MTYGGAVAKDITLGRKEILEGMLGANLVGFQSSSYLQHFLSSCTRILGYDYGAEGVKTYGSHTSVGVFPIGIDAAKVEARAMQPGIEVKMKAIKEMYAGKKIIVGRDRLDSVRGVMQKLRAFEAFLEMYEEWREKVSLTFFLYARTSNTFISHTFYIDVIGFFIRLCLNLLNYFIIRARLTGT